MQMSIETENTMDDPKFYTDEERQLLPDDDLAHNLLKKERHLLADLHNAQEAEARALERFRRVQSKLQRRKARVLRLENRLALTRKELAVLQSNLNSQDQQNGHVSASPEPPVRELMATPDEAASPPPADALHSVSSSERTEAIAPTTTPSDLEVAAPTPPEDRPDTFEPEPFVTPVFVSAFEPAAGDTSPVAQPTDMAEPADVVESSKQEGDTSPVAQPTNLEETQPAQQPSSLEGVVVTSEAREVRAEDATRVGDTTHEQPQAQEAVAGVVIATPTKEPIVSDPGASLLEQLARDISTPPVEAQSILTDGGGSQEESEPAPLIEPEPSPAMNPATPPAMIAQEEAGSSPMLAEAMGLWKTTETEALPTQSTSDDSSANLSPGDRISSPQPMPPAKSPVQILNEAREAWQEAEAGVQQARNRAHDLAASISILAQTGLSGTLMEELLRKQSEANKALVESQKSARGAYERLVQAEEAYQLAQQEEQSHTNGLTSTSTDDGDTTVQMHAIHLYKEW